MLRHGSGKRAYASRFMIDDLPVLFPYPRIYPEQYQYMRDLKHTLDAGVI